MPSPTLPIRVRVMLTYSALCVSVYVIFAYTKTKWYTNQQRRSNVDKKVLHQEKVSRKLLAEFPNKAFELIPTVFNVLETCVFSVR